jgi:hypothetical protein
MVKRVATLSIGGVLLLLTGCQQQPTAGYGYPVAPQPQYQGYQQPAQNSLINPQYLQMALGLAQQVLPLVFGSQPQYRPPYPQYPALQYRTQPAQYPTQQLYRAPTPTGVQSQPQRQSQQPVAQRTQPPTGTQSQLQLDPTTTQQLMGLFSALLGVQPQTPQPTQPQNPSQTTGKVLRR